MASLRESSCCQLADLVRQMVLPPGVIATLGTSLRRPLAALARQTVR